MNKAVIAASNIVVFKPFTSHLLLQQPMWVTSHRHAISGTIMTGRRPAHVKPPAHLSKSPPVPEPAPMQRPDTDPLGRDPVRYGDWEKKGIAVDF
jgi:hypothetical protein